MKELAFFISAVIICFFLCVKLRSMDLYYEDKYIGCHKLILETRNYCYEGCDKFVKSDDCKDLCYTSYAENYKMCECA